MNTKMMRLPPRRVLTPSSTTSTTNKRKERDEPFDRPKPITTTATTTTSKLLKPDRPISKPISEPVITTTSTSSCSSKDLELPSSNQLLAGYLAHEFLTKGTLFGQPWDQARAETPIVAERKKEKEGEDSSSGGGGEGEGGPVVAPPCRRAEEVEERERYAKVAGLLKNGGVHLQGVVNPTQLARFLHL